MYIKHLKLFREAEPLSVEIDLKVLASGNVQLRLEATTHCTCLDRLALNLLLDGQTVERGILERSVDSDNILQLKVRRARDLITLANSFLLKRQYLDDFTGYWGPNMMGRVDPVRTRVVVCQRCGWARLRST